MLTEYKAKGCPLPLFPDIVPVILNVPSVVLVTVCSLEPPEVTVILLKGSLPVKTTDIERLLVKTNFLSFPSLIYLHQNLLAPLTPIKCKLGWYEYLLWPCALPKYPPSPIFAYYGITQFPPSVLNQNSGEFKPGGTVGFVFEAQDTHEILVVGLRSSSVQHLSIAQICVTQRLAQD